jgi:hypothetical protein
MMLAFGFGLYRTQKNFLIIVFEPLLKYRHDTLTYLKNRRNPKTVSFRRPKTSPKNATKWAKKPADFLHFYRKKALVFGMKTGLDTGNFDAAARVARPRSSSRNILTQITDGLAGVLQQLAPDLGETQSCVEGVGARIGRVEIDLADHSFMVGGGRPGEQVFI